MKKIFLLFIALFSSIGFLYSQKADSLFASAFSKYQSGDYKGSVENYTLAIKIKPDYNDAYFNRAISYDKMGEYKKALADFTKIISSAPTAEVYLNRGQVTLRMG